MSTDEREPPITREMMMASMRAIHEAYGIITTRCKDVNRVLYEYPEGRDNTAAIRALLADHDAGRCHCNDAKEGAKP